LLRDINERLFIFNGILKF